MTNELADHMAAIDTIIGTFVQLRQRALRVMFDGAGHMVKPVARWTELTRLNRLWDSAWADYKVLETSLIRARALPVVNRELLEDLRAHRDELRNQMAGYEMEFEAELARLLGGASWPSATKVFEVV